MRRVVRRRRLKFRPSTRCACQSDGAKKASLPIDGPVNRIRFRPDRNTIGPLQRKFCERECGSPQRLSKKGGARWIQDTERAANANLLRLFLTIGPYIGPYTTSEKLSVWKCLREPCQLGCVMPRANILLWLSLYLLAAEVPLSTRQAPIASRALMTLI